MKSEPLHRPSSLLPGVLAALLVAASALAQPEKAPPDPVKVIYVPTLASAPIFLAEASGFFGAEGIKLEKVQTGNTSVAIPALAQGELDVGSVALRPGVFAMIAKGARIRIVADKGRLTNACSMSRLAVRRGPDGSPVKAGKLGMTPLSSSEYLARSIFESRGLDSSAFEIVAIPDRLNFDALMAGTVDAALIGDNENEAAQKAGFIVLGSGEAVRPGLQYGVLLYGASLLDRKPDVGRRFMKAYLRGVAMLNEGKTDRNLRILSTELGQTAEYLTKECWFGFSADGRIDTASLDTFQAWAVKRGWFDRVVTVGEYWDGRFIAPSGGK